MSKDKSKKWVISAPLFYNYARIPKKNTRNSRISSKSAKKILGILEFLSKYLANILPLNHKISKLKAVFCTL